MSNTDWKALHAANDSALEAQAAQRKIAHAATRAAGLAHTARIYAERDHMRAGRAHVEAMHELRRHDLEIAAVADGLLAGRAEVRGILEARHTSLVETRVSLADAVEKRASELAVARADAEEKLATAKSTEAARAAEVEKYAHAEEVYAAAAKALEDAIVANHRAFQAHPLAPPADAKPAP